MDKPLETLGIVIIDNDEDNYKYNFHQKILILKSILNIWKIIKLSLKGNITALNSLALARLIYTSSVIKTPKKAISEINNIIQNVMWDGSILKFSQQTLIQSIQNGGLKLCNFETKVKALILCWVKGYVAMTMQHTPFYHKYSVNAPKLNILFSGNHILPSKLNISRFYTDVYNLYIENFNKEPLTIMETLNLLLWYNSFLNSNTSIHSF